MSKRKKGALMIFISLIIFTVFNLKLRSAENLNILILPYEKGPELGVELSTNEYNKLREEYKTWRSTYVTKSGCPKSWMSRVKRDKASDEDTVSEGQAYGMLLSVLWGDKETFERLQHYYRHYSYYGTTSNGLMHWKINKDGKKISEFNIEFEDPENGSGRKHDIAYVRLSELLDESNYERDYYLEYRTDKAGVNGWVQAHEYERGHSSATDADLDAMAAYMYAGYRWVDADAKKYREHAAYVLTQIFDYQIGGNGGYNDDNGNRVGYELDKFFIRAGCQWGGPKGWNPSYFTPAWFHLAQKFLDDWGNESGVNNILKDGIRFQEQQNKPGGTTDPAAFYKFACSRVLETMYIHMRKIEACNQKGLYPDWVDTDSGDIFDPKWPVPANISDRMYWVDKPVRVNNGVQIIGDLEATDGHYKRQSYNFYYDAIRVPWRLFHAWNLYGDTEAENLIKDKTNSIRYWRYKWDDVVDGYYWQQGYSTGDEWRWQWRDPFNMSRGGLNGDEGINGGADVSVTFSSMIGITTMYINNSAHKSNAKAAYDFIFTNKETHDVYNYYGNTLRMISLTYLAGGFGDYSKIMPQ